MSNTLERLQKECDDARADMVFEIAGTGPLTHGEHDALDRLCRAHEALGRLNVLREALDYVTTRVVTLRDRGYGDSGLELREVQEHFAAAIRAPAPVRPEEVKNE